MNKTIKLLISAIFLLAGVAASAKDFKLPLGQFSKLNVDDNVDVVYVGGDRSPSRVAYSGDAKFARAFIITQKGGKVRIQVETEFVGNPNLPTLYVYSDFLESATLSSESTLTLKSVAPNPKLSLTLMGNGNIVAHDVRSTKVSAGLKSGNGTISLTGECQDADFLMLGNGVIQADGLEAQNVTCKIFGTGTIGCWAADKLDVKGLGTTKVYYKGQPEIKRKGGGKLFSIDNDSIEN